MKKGQNIKQFQRTPNFKKKHTILLTSRKSSLKHGTSKASSQRNITNKTFLTIWAAAAQIPIKSHVIVKKQVTIMVREEAIDSIEAKTGDRREEIGIMTEKIVRNVKTGGNNVMKETTDEKLQTVHSLQQIMSQNDLDFCGGALNSVTTISSGCLSCLVELIFDNVSSMI